MKILAALLLTLAADFSAVCTPTECTLTATGESFVRVRWTVDGVALADSLQKTPTRFRAYGPDTPTVVLTGYRSDGTRSQKTKKILVPAAPSDSIAGLPPFNGAIPRDTIVFNGNAVFVYKLLGFVYREARDSTQWYAVRYSYPVQDSVGVWIVPPMVSDSARYPSRDGAKRALATPQPIQP